jgi:hypothetical protein
MFLLAGFLQCKDNYIKYQTIFLMHQYGKSFAGIKSLDFRWKPGIFRSLWGMGYKACAVGYYFVIAQENIWR